MSSIEYISGTTLVADTASVTLSDIPGTYSDLILVCTMTAENLRNPLLRFNGDSSTNYSTTWLAGYSTSTVASSRNSNSTSITGCLVYSGMSSTNQTNTMWQIMSYANTNIHKTTLEAGGLSSTEINRHVGLWRSTSAITNLTIILNGSGNFKSGSVFSLWGVK